MPAKSRIPLFISFVLASVLFTASEVWAEGTKDCPTQDPITEEFLDTMKTVMLLQEIQILKVLFNEIEKNGYMYLIGPPDVGIYFMQRNLGLLESLKGYEFAIIPGGVRSWDETLTYARLGEAYKRAGNMAEADAALSQAWDAYKETGHKKFTSLEELLEFVARLDTTTLEYMRTKHAKDTVPFTMPSEESARGGSVDE